MQGIMLSVNGQTVQRAVAKGKIELEKRIDARDCQPKFVYINPADLLIEGLTVILDETISPGKIRITTAVKESIPQLVA